MGGVAFGGLECRIVGGCVFRGFEYEGSSIDCVNRCDRDELSDTADGKDVCALFIPA